MCGIAGYFNFSNRRRDLRRLERMIWPVQHRGPDGYGFFCDERAGLAHARLSIIDLEGGWQPIHNEDKSLWVIFNGEIFNYPELRQGLEHRGHGFYTNSDTEVIIHLYEEYGPDCVRELNGQFAIAIYDQAEKSIFLARDRMGIRPLFYTFFDNRLLFASEIKSLFAFDSLVKREIDQDVLAEIFTFWTPAGTDTVFRGIRQLPPAGWLMSDIEGHVESGQYWKLSFEPDSAVSWGSEDDLAAELRDLMVDSVRLRLRSDVPVGAYLSGGIDSSAITSLIKNYTDNPLKTFSVAFSDSVYDESSQQQEMASWLGTDHNVIRCGYKDIADGFPDVVWHTETPVVRTAPTPLFLLSGLVRQHDYKVVLTGEGADEILGGYDIFKEAKVRAFISRAPESSCRPLLLKRLYPYLALSPTRASAMAKQVFESGSSPDDDIFFAHRPRWKTTSYILQLMERDIRESMSDPLEKLEANFKPRLSDGGYDYFSRAQYLESRLLLANYLLCSQGDRMAMAHSVEGRFPFLDHRVVEFAGRLPLNMRMKGLTEKYLLKLAMKDILPPSIVQRRKQPYMAPDILSFFSESEPDYLKYYLSREKIESAGLFNPGAVGRLMNKCRKKARQGFRENMAFVSILSSQILHDRFVENFTVDPPDILGNVKIVQ